MQDIGAKLKAKREELGYRIEDVVEKTKLHPSALHDIEEGNLSNVSPAYLRGFLRIYAKFLGVDISDELKDVPSAQNIEKKPKPQKIPVQKPVVAPAKTPPASKSQSVPPFKTVVNLQPSTSGRQIPSPAQKPWVNSHASVQEAPESKPSIKIKIPPQALKSFGIAIAVVLALVVVSKVMPPLVEKIKTNHVLAVEKAQIRKAENERRHAVDVEKKRREKVKREWEKKRAKAQKEALKKAKVQESNSSVVSSGEETLENSGATVAIPATRSRDIVVSVTTKKDCFVRANVDGRILFENVLRKGVAKTWRAKKDVDLKLSDGSAVIVEVNGSIIPPLSSRPRAIKSLKINHKGISVDK